MIERRFNYSLCRKPDLLIFNDDKTKVFIAAKIDVLFIDLENDQEYDIDTHFTVSHVKACVYNKGTFYVLTNMWDKHKGIYLFNF